MNPIDLGTIVACLVTIVAVGLAVWRDLRWWVTALVVVQLVIYAIFS